MADRSALARATEGTDAPTPGYLYADIAKSAASSPIAAQEIATYLTRRLASKSNHNIKYKCLKVITKTTEGGMGRCQFKRIISQNPDAMTSIKEALNFRGRPDPARGDEIYARVRTAAKECLDAVYSDTPSSEMVGGGGGMSGYGSSGSAVNGAGGFGSPGPGAGGPRRMEGFGNPMMSDPRSQSNKNMTIGEVAAAAGETIVGMIKDPLANNVQAAPSVTSRSNMQGFGSHNPPPGQNELAVTTGGKWTMASNRGPGAINPPQNFNGDRDQAYYKSRDGGSNAFQWAQSGGSAGPSAPVTSGVGGSWATETPSTVSSVSVAALARAPAHQIFSPSAHGSVGSPIGIASTDGTYERNLIIELCPPGGMKPEPPPEKLEAFKKSISSLDPDLVCPALLDCLEDGQPWIMRAKALCVIEATIKTAEQIGTTAYIDFFHTCGQKIEPLATHHRQAIRDPAKRIVTALGLTSSVSSSENTQSSATATPTVAAPPLEPPNLLEFDDVPALAPISSPIAPPPAAAPPVPQPAESDSLFGGLTVQSSKAETPTKSEKEEPVASPAPSSNGLFGDMMVKSPVTNDENRAVSTATDNMEEATAVAGSAFGFMNEGPTPTTERSSSTVSKESFDPLLNASSDVNKETDSERLSKMQAVAYQQNMFMMQQQMQQMQMAFVMQQQQMAGKSMRMMPQQNVPSGGANRTFSLPLAATTGPMNPNIMKANSMRQIPVVGVESGKGNGSANQFSFLDNPAAKAKEKADQSFEFIKDTMKDAK